VSQVNPLLNREVRRPQPKMFKKPSIRARGRAARWSLIASPDRKLRRWQRSAPQTAGDTEQPAPNDRFAQFNVQAEVPQYDAPTYDRSLANADWTRDETDHLVELYRECNGKWPVIADHYSFGEKERTMEDLKSRFYSISATLLQLQNPITSMTATEYSLYETLNGFSPEHETSRKKLAEGHLYRRANEVDEETVLLGELQRIMLNQASLDSEREELRRRLDFPHTSNSYQYSTSQQLHQLWQQLLAQDRMKKNPRLRPTGNPAYDGYQTATPTSARPRDSNAGLPDSASGPGRKARDSLPASAAAASASATAASATATTPQSTAPSDLSKADCLRFGVVQPHDKLPSGVTFASDRLSKPRVAKSTVQTDKIGAVLAHIGVPNLIPIPTPAVVDMFETIMGRVLALLDLRKLAEREEQELRVRGAETAA